MTTQKKRKPYGKMIIFGILSLGSYVFLFTHLDFVNDNFVRGGYYAALPIMTALYFSFVHGAFASNLISVVGLKPNSNRH